MCPQQVRAPHAPDPPSPPGQAAVNAMLEEPRQAPSRPRLLAITGARGGLGASTFLIHLAWALRRQGRRVAMVDLDPAGGLGLLLGDEALPGLRWADLPVRESAFRPGRLIGALPAWHAIPFLTGDGRGGACPAVTAADAAAGSCLDAVLTALLSEHDVVLIDLPRGMGPPRGSQVMLVTGLDLRSAVACEALMPRLHRAARVPVAWQDSGRRGGRGSAQGVSLVLRQLGEDVSVADLELVTGSRVIAALPTDRAIRQRILRGEDPVRSRSAMRRAVGALARFLETQETQEDPASWPGRAGADEAGEPGLGAQEPGRRDWEAAPAQEVRAGDA